MSEEEWFFTFIGRHWCNTHGSLGRRYVRLKGTFTETRTQMIDVIGTHWGFQYPISDLEEQVQKYGLVEVDLNTIGEVRSD